MSHDPTDHFSLPRAEEVSSSQPISAADAFHAVSAFLSDEHIDDGEPNYWTGLYRIYESYCVETDRQHDLSKLRLNLPPKLPEPSMNVVKAEQVSEVANQEQDPREKPTRVENPDDSSLDAEREKSLGNDRKTKAPPTTAKKTAKKKKKKKEGRK